MKLIKVFTPVNKIEKKRLIHCLSSFSSSIINNVFKPIFIKRNESSGIEVVFLSISEPLSKKGLKYKIFVIIAIRLSKMIDIIDNGPNISNQIPDLHGKEEQILLLSPLQSNTVVNNKNIWPKKVYEIIGKNILKNDIGQITFNFLYFILSPINIKNIIDNNNIIIKIEIVVI